MTRLTKIAFASLLFTGFISFTGWSSRILGVHFSQTSIAFAQDTIDVAGVGTAFAMPDTLIIRGRISGSGEVKDATKIIDGLKGDITKAMTDEAFAGVKMSFGSRKIEAGINSNDDPRIAMMEMMGEQMPSDEDMGAFNMSESFDLSITGLTEENFDDKINLMTQLATALNDRQIKLGANKDANYSPYNFMGSKEESFLQVRLSSSKTAWKEASKLAFEDAKEKAETLAEISGGSLGRVVAIASSEVGINDEPAMAIQVIQEMYSGITGGPSGSAYDESNHSVISQSRLAKIAVSVRLEVRFSFTAKP